MSVAFWWLRYLGSLALVGFGSYYVTFGLLIGMWPNVVLGLMFVVLGALASYATWAEKEE